VIKMVEHLPAFRGGSSNTLPCFTSDSVRSREFLREQVGDEVRAVGGQELVHVPREPITLHWVAGSGTNAFEPMEYLERRLCEALGQTDLVQADYGLNGYKKMLMAPFGIKLLFAPSVANQPDYHLIIPGDACEYLGVEKLKPLLYNLRLTRFDLAFDDFPLSPARVLEEFKAGRVRTKIRRDSFSEQYNAKGDSIYIGKRGSGTQYLNVYNSRGFVRAELRLSGERAEKARDDFLCSNEKTFASFAISRLRDCLDFIEPESDVNVSRAKLQEWWQLFVQDIARANVKLTPKPVAAIQKMATWLHQNVAASLVTYLRVVGIDALEPFLMYGLDRMKPYQKAQVKKTPGNIRRQLRLKIRALEHVPVYSMIGT
jgi:hypothetical protein